MGSINAKMAEGVLRYARNPIVAVIDTKLAGNRVSEVCSVRSDVPIVATLDEAVSMGAKVLVLGTAPSGGRMPADWITMLSTAIDAGLSIVNGMHDRLNDMFGDQLRPGQWIWDIRTPVGDMPDIATARAAALGNIKVLMIGTDMAVGKMTAGLEIHKSLLSQGANAVFLATGQIGMTIIGGGIPLDAYRVDYASGAVERMVMDAGDADIMIIEGQGSLLHPGSTATLPLMRGSCANKMILCHRAGMEVLDTAGEIKIPTLGDVIALNEMTASANGTLTEAKVVGIALNTSALDQPSALAEIARLEADLGLPVQDTVRFGAEKLARAVKA